MALQKFSVQFPATLGSFVTRLQIGGTWYNIPAYPINTADILLQTNLNTALNSIPFSDVYLGNSILPPVPVGQIAIRAVCTNKVLNNIEVDNSGSLTIYPFVASVCSKGLSCLQSLNVTANINFDCNTSLFSFTDTTREYNALTNPNGYGVTIGSSLSNINNVDFYLWSGVTLVGIYNSPYLPNSAGTSTINLSSTNFGLGAFVPNTTYTLEYRLNTVGGNQGTCISQDILIPCCGGTIPSNNSVKFTTTEKIGCSSFDFTDTTGVYNLTTNANGYGAPNFDYSDITSTLIRVTRADGRVFDITRFIPTLLAPTITINNSEIGYTDEIESQVMTIEYFVYASVGCRIAYMKQEVLFHCQLKKCIQNRAIEILKEDCDSCDANNDSQKVMNMLLNYQAILITSKHNVGCLKKVISNLLIDCKKGCNDC